MSGRATATLLYDMRTGASVTAPVSRWFDVTYHPGFIGGAAYIGPLDGCACPHPRPGQARSVRHPRVVRSFDTRMEAEAFCDEMNRGRTLTQRHVRKAEYRVVERPELCPVHRHSTSAHLRAIRNL